MGKLPFAFPCFCLFRLRHAESQDDEAIGIERRDKEEEESAKAYLTSNDILPSSINLMFFKQETELRSPDEAELVVWSFSLFTHLMIMNEENCDHKG